MGKNIKSANANQSQVVQNTGFGAPNNTSFSQPAAVFSTPTPATTFGFNSAPAFGNSNNVAGSAFGGSTTTYIGGAFGQQQNTNPSGFGAPASTPNAGFSFGSNNNNTGKIQMTFSFCI